MTVHGAIEASTLSGPLESEDVVFYTHTLCPYAQRVWLTLVEKEIEHELVHVDLSQKPGWFRVVNPRGLVPCVTLREQTIIESADICQWLDENFGGPSLMPAEPALRAVASSCLTQTDRFINAGLSLAAGRDGRFWGVGCNASKADIAQFESICAQTIVRALRETGGPFMTGERVSLADIMYWPFMERFALCAANFSGYDVGKIGKGAVRTWMEAMTGRESCRVAAADPAKMLQAVAQHRSLDFFDYVTYTAFQLHQR